MDLFYHKVREDAEKDGSKGDHERHEKVLYPEDIARSPEKDKEDERQVKEVYLE